MSKSKEEENMEDVPIWAKLEFLAGEKTKSIVRFKLGQIYMTRGVNDLVVKDEKFAKFVWDSLKRHARGDWGDLCKEDKEENEFALDKYLRIFSAYETGPRKIWIITEADRSVTTILFPEEY